MFKNNNWFTVVELMVVTVILALLWAIWLVTYYSSLTWVSDSSKLVIIEWLNKWLDIYRTQSEIPFPSNRVKIYSSWLTTDNELIAYQWELWEDQFHKIGYNFSENIKKSDKTKIFYYMTKDRKYYQLMTFLNDKTSAPNYGIKEVDSFQEYKDKTPVLYWEHLGILTDPNNTPVSEISNYKDKWSVNLTADDKDDYFRAHIYNFKSYTFLWEEIGSKIYALAKPWDYKAPDDCPLWFVWVPWNPDFWQEGFCVAKYEMTYESGTGILSSWYATYIFESDKKIASKIWYPIASLTINEALESCKKLWRKYHLITNNEWMTIARNIELEVKNWSNKEEWTENIDYNSIQNWYIYNWNASNTWIHSDYNWCDTSWYEAWLNWNKTWPTSTQEWCNEKRSFHLSNWEIIWDFSWNVWEFVKKDNDIYSTIEVNSDLFDSNIAMRSSADEEIMKTYWPKIWLSTYTHWIWALITNSRTDDIKTDDIITRWWSSVWLANSYAWIYSIILKEYNEKFNYLWFRCAMSK